MDEWIRNTLEQSGLLGVGLLMLAENVFPPIPSEVVMPWAGFTASQGKLSLAGVIAAGSLGSFAGAMLWYLLARWIGKERLIRWVQRHGWWLTLSERDIERTDAWFDRWGGIAVLLCRMIPGIRTLISVPAGLSGMGLSKFSVYTAIGTVLWTALLATIGWWLGDNYQSVAGPLGWVSTIVVCTLLAWWLFRLATHAARKQRAE